MWHFCIDILQKHTYGDSTQNLLKNNLVIHFHSISFGAFTFNYKLKGKPTAFSHLSDLRTAQSGVVSKINKGNPDCPCKSPFTMWLI